MLDLLRAHGRFVLLLILCGAVAGSAGALLAILPTSADGIRVLPTAALGSAFAAAALGAVLLARRYVRDLDRLRRAASEWSRGEWGPSGLPPSSPLRSASEALDRMASALRERDDAARRRAEEQILFTEKLATTGRLAAGVAHEINNPLGGILLCTDLLLEGTAADDPRRETLLRISEQAGRAREIVRGLLDFARQSHAEVKRLDLNPCLRGVLSLLERQPLFQRVRLRSELSSTPLWIQGDPGKLQQVFINIVMNALEAMREGGTLTIRSGFSEEPGFCRVAVTDTGYGIREADLPRIFEPFFTTKEVGHGLGLGLAIAFGIVEQHRGRIEVTSAAGAGATFRVLLPLESGEGVQ